MTRPFRHAGGRVQHRTGGGRFRRSTLADFGLAAEVCGACGGFIPRGLGECLPEACGQCGAVIVRERCERVAKVPPRHLGPRDMADMAAGAFDPCGKPAIGCQIESRAARCAEHIEGRTS